MEQIIHQNKQNIENYNTNSKYLPGRRDFIKTTGLISAGFAASMILSSPVLRAFEKKTDKHEKTLAYEGKWVPSTCQGCTTWCAIEFFVQNGRVVKVRGNQQSQSNQGFVCPKGHLQIMELYDPDRVKVPMKRTNPNKGPNENPEFIPITWDEALDTLATKMMELRTNNESHKFLMLRGRYSSYSTDHVYSALTKIYGSPNGISHSSLCAEAEKFGPYYTEGFWGYRDYDVTKSKCVVIWGCDPLCSNRQIPNMINKFGAMMENATVITIDPRMSTSAVKSHIWMPIQPGEDGALASALAHIILTEGLWSKEFVGDFNDGVNKFIPGQTVDEASFTEVHTSGLVKWWNLELKDKTAEWAEPITKLSKEQIIKVARAMGNSAPKTLVWLGPGPVMSPRGGYTSMAIHSLNGLLGSVDNEGGTLRSPSISSKSYPDVVPYEDDIAKAGLKFKKIDQRGYKAFPSLDAGKVGTAVVTNNVADAILAEDPYDIKVILGYWCNFVFSGTQGQRWEEALSKVPFFCHITTNASEMTHYADIVLPAAHHSTEKWSASNSMANLYSFMSIQQPVVNRFWDVKADENEIMWALAEKLKTKGFSNLYDFYSTEFKDPETSATPTTEEEFAIFSTKFRTKPSYDTIGGWEKFKEQGIVNSAQYTYRKTWDNMGTVTKKFEFYSETLKKVLNEHATKHTTTVDDILTTCNYTAQGELAYVPHYEPPMRKGSKEEYPFEFIDYKSKLNREGRSQNIPWYYEFHKVNIGDVAWDDVVKMNPKDAQKLGLTDGEKVRITSIVGSIEATLKTWEGVREGTVTKAYGQGHTKYGKVASLDYATGKPRGGNNNYIIPAEYERLSGSNSRNGGFFGVKIEKATTGIFGSDEKVSRNINVSDIFPNPAREYATIGITLQTDASVKISVYNVSGRNVINVHNGRLSQGSHTLRIDISQLESGMYICQVQSGTYRTALKLIVEK